MQDTERTRIERDSMGEMAVPAEAYYGASTQRAVLNFPISDLRMSRLFLRSLGLIKRAAAEVNADLGLNGPACLNVWSYLCNKLTEALVDFYDPKQRVEGEPNPRLGCWGPRPDLAECGLAEDDCGLAVVIGLATWTVGARPLGTEPDLLERLAEAVIRALGYWVLVARRVQTRKN